MRRLLLILAVAGLSACDRSSEQVGGKESDRAGRELAAKNAKVNYDLNVLKAALKNFQIHTGSYPTTAQGLRALVENPGNVKRWEPMLKGPLVDPWGNPYGYRYPAKHNRPSEPDIFSHGPDGVADTGDDLGNW